MEDEHNTTSPSLKHKLKQTLCLSCCFRSNHHEALESPSTDKRRFVRASSMWLKSRAHEFPDIRQKCCHLISRIGKHRKYSSADFRYDPLSYSLNFDEGYEDAYLDEAPLRNFSSRLPASPPRRAAEVDNVVSREITAVS